MIKGKKKEEATPSSFDNSKPFIKAITMIILSFKKVKKNVENNIQKYKKLNNFGFLKCPICNSSDYIRWVFYERGITYYKNNEIHSEVIQIQRIRCKSCGHTHALLPFGIIPYKQVSDEIIIDLLLEENILYNEVIDYWNKQFIEYHYPYLVTLLHIKKKKEIIKNIKHNKNKILMEYILRYKKCFMQIKFCFIGLHFL